MTQKTKAIIIIIGAIILFSLLVMVIFDLFPSKEEQSVPEEQAQEIILPDKNEALPENQVFDASNAQEFSDLNLFQSSDDIGLLEKEAKELAVFFIERFGTYSSDSRFANIDDLIGFMTSDMKSDMQDYKKSTPKRNSYYSVVSEIALIDTKSFSLNNRSASFDIVVNREEEFGNSTDQYQQKVQVFLEQDRTGQWKINNVVWGKKI